MEHHGVNFSIYNGDCVTRLAQFPDACVDVSVYSPPFADLYCYSSSISDMGNSSYEEFFKQYAFLLAEMLRVTKPGRMTYVHCMDVRKVKHTDGHLGLRDFSGDIVRAHLAAGWIFSARKTIWKSPVTEMARTKNVALLFKQLRSDSVKSHGGLPDYLLTFTKPGDNAVPITHTADDFPLQQWQEWASPVWLTVDQTNVLNSVKAKGDEKHLCPLQLDVIERALVLGSNRGETVLSPFAGIGSEGVMALKLGRRFIGVELKPEYYQTGLKNLRAQEDQLDLFAGLVPQQEEANGRQEGDDAGQPHAADGPQASEKRPGGGDDNEARGLASPV